MKVMAFNARPDERAFFDHFSQSLDMDLTLQKDTLTLDNVALTRGYDGISCTCDLPAPILEKLAENGVRYVALRTIGYDNVDLKAAERLGIRVSHAGYSPYAVSNYTVMLMLMCLRNYKQALWRGQVNDYSLFGLIGREMRSLTVGVIGTGRIGQAVLRNLTGFGCRLLAYNAHQRPEVREIAEYVTLDELYRQCDIITIHMPLVESTRHFINSDSIRKMKKGVILINCARGALADLDALIEGIESEKIGALGLDVVEGEEGITHVDHRIDIISNQKMAYLRQFRNVVMTQHMAFYTEEAVENMVRSGILGILEMSRSEKGSTEL